MRSSVLVLLVFLAVSVAGCVRPSSPAAAQDDLAQHGAEQDGEAVLRVVSTMSVFSDFASAVGGDLVAVDTLVPVGGDPHTYEATPADAATITDADIVLDNGLGLSPWFESLAGNVEGELVILTDGIVEEAVAASGKVDPHMWMVPDYVDRGYITAIEAAFAAADPSNADAYADNADSYRQTLADLDAELAEGMASIPVANRKLVTSHDAYRYFAAAYGLAVTGSVVGVTTEEEPSAAVVARLVDTVRAEGVPTIFLETTVNPALIEQVARDAGVAVGEPLYGDSVGAEGSGAEDYAGMMRANVRAIVAGLGGEGVESTGDG
ncbi:MAG: metal ABC transporter substrate-binding protein [Euzebya sp.]